MKKVVISGSSKLQEYILNMPSEEVQSYDEVKFWLDKGWIKLYNEEDFK